MPHKKNPALIELLITIANLNANKLSILHNAVMHENERDGISWMMEWETLNSMIKLTSSAIKHCTEILKRLKINKKNMLSNLDDTYGHAMSDYYFHKMSKSLEYSKLKKIFPKLLRETKKNKIHLSNVIASKINKPVSYRYTNEYEKNIGINNKIINDIIKRYNEIF